MPETDPVTQHPWLHDLVTSLSAPTTVLSDASGQIRERGVQGVLHCDVRVLSSAVLLVDGEEPTPIGGGPVSAGVARFVAVPRRLGGDGPDAVMRVDRTRSVGAGRVEERIELSSDRPRPVPATVTLVVAPARQRVETIRSPGSPPLVAPDRSVDESHVRWGADEVVADLDAPGARIDDDGQAVRLHWTVEVPVGGAVSLTWRLTLEAPTAPVTGLGDRNVPALHREPQAQADDRRLAALIGTSWSDLQALRMAPADDPGAVFLGAGSPWYFTLFGRDSLWAARLLLPFGTDLAEGTLRALAARQGTTTDPATDEEPGKILHELRATATRHAQGGVEGGMSLPPLYYGTIDATLLWICLLHDAWRWGMAEDTVRSLVPALEAALGWLGDQGDEFVRYPGSSTGLANQGWKDSPDAVRFADGTIADGPVALCEVQGYAHEAAVHGADLLDHFGRPGGVSWRDRAQRLATRFRESFWVTGADGERFPALALDGSGRPVDALTSNIGHLLGTGLLSSAESEQVARLLRGPALSSGFGLRTMASTEGGYWPLSYHCGSVWAHDTAIAIHGLHRSGLGASAFGLVEGLLRTAAEFGYRLPELHSGEGGSLVPYPAACRPQAWSAAAIGPLVQVLAGLSADNGTLECLPPQNSPFGALRVSGLRFGPDEATVTVDREGRGRLTTPTQPLP
ncbi:glycogen debranching N-terminal domain-containing protein [Kineosporia mesophila]|uniref:Glycogen debranching N-terminal domain-containing protein n=1 Tax=Kineosporia mesophila TaxID=566012 RepID=A0ABP6ZDQ0_9ACTN|nr:glycogen debranching N-terminal domain-containing protein [Kineosporia mesophila]MCD5350359.1 hypothetical protein [Kineosporia mesophila]